VGIHPLRIEATDEAGNSATILKTINVRYKFEDFDSPFKKDSEFNSNRTIPIKWGLLDVDDNLVHHIKGKIIILNNKAEAVLADDFKEEGNSGIYKYNLKTSDIGIGSFTIQIKPDDGSIFTKIINIIK
ncbi:MAG: hypothetical protein NTV03_03235, partial [Candidatus Nomurabacteria bacterium]|nr:hypothetical protein [Candidatus Nomurabacteria bacterium]